MATYDVALILKGKTKEMFNTYAKNSGRKKTDIAYEAICKLLFDLPGAALDNGEPLMSSDELDSFIDEQVKAI